MSDRNGYVGSMPRTDKWTDRPLLLVATRE